MHEERVTARKVCSLFIALVVTTTLISGCGVSNARAIGVSEGTRIHQLLNDEKCAEIYFSSSTEFRQVTTEQQWIAFCAGARRTLGKWKRSTVKDTQVILVDSGGYIVNVDYEIEFEKGPAVESVSFFIRGGRAELRSYSINSPLLSPVKSAEAER